MHQYTGASVCYPSISWSVGRSVGRSVGQSVSHSVSWSVSQLISQSSRKRKQNCNYLSGTMIKFLPLDILGLSHIEFHCKNKKAVYRLQISALVPEIFKFEKCVKYANEMTDNLFRSTQILFQVYK